MSVPQDHVIARQQREANRRARRQPVATQGVPEDLPAPAVASGGRAPTFLWDGRPVYRCQVCQYERMENLQAVLQHETEVHGAPPPINALVAVRNQAVSA